MTEFEEEGRTILISGPIDGKVTAAAINRIIEINDLDQTRAARFRFAGDPPPIRIVINTPGGSLYDALALIGAMESSETPIETVTLGAAMSAGFLLAVSGHNRITHRYTTYMLHQLAAGVEGKLGDIDTEVVQMKRTEDILVNHLLQRTKMSKAQIMEIFSSRKEHYFTAEEALEMGLADEMILGGQDEEQQEGVREDI